MDGEYMHVRVNLNEIEHICMQIFKYSLMQLIGKLS